MLRHLRQKIALKYIYKKVIISEMKTKMKLNLLLLNKATLLPFEMFDAFTAKKKVGSMQCTL